ncbi:MAG: hypothetical protein IJK39_05890 [Bacteroidales bacterium]|nr:hypothetical protein [Bacteroidales bacterium]
MAEVITQIPGYEKGTVQTVVASDEEGAIVLSAQVVSDLLNKWNTTVAFFSLTSRSEKLLELVNNQSSVARLFTVNQKNHSFPVIENKARGMVHSKFVRAVVIEGLPEQDLNHQYWLHRLAKSAHIPVVQIVIKKKDEAVKQIQQTGANNNNTR